MSEKKFKLEYLYFKSNDSGLFLTMPGELPSVHFNPSALKPDEAMYGLATVDKSNKELVEAILSHPNYGKKFFRMPTAEELAEEERLVECAKFAKQIKESLADGAVQMNLKELKQAELYEFANKVGVSVKEDDKEKTKAQVIKEVEKILTIETAEEPSEEDK